jgi:hypothetical protein
MSGKKSEWVYDELLCFLGSAFFNVPVDGFIEAKCLSRRTYFYIKNPFANVFVDNIDMTS